MRIIRQEAPLRSAFANRRSVGFHVRVIYTLAKGLVTDPHPNRAFRASARHLARGVGTLLLRLRETFVCDFVEADFSLTHETSAT